MNRNEPPTEEQTPIKTVLVVEDDDAIGEIILLTIQLVTPYQALLATDGFQALQMVRHIPPQ